MIDLPIMCTCEICGTTYQAGPEIHEGHYVQAYDLGVCGMCYRSNHDGWGPYHEPKLVAHLTHKGIPIPKRNSSGWIPRGD